MASLRWVLLLIGLIFLGLMFAYGRGWLRLKFPARWRKRAEPADADPALVEDTSDAAATTASEPDPEPVVEPEPSAPRLEENSRVVAVRIMPQPGCLFPAEEMILALRGAGLKHGQYGIFHCPDDKVSGRTRYSVASLAEPGSFDLSKLKDSEYPGISIFMVLPAPENAVDLFDDMLTTARKIAADMDGRLADEQGGPLSLQRERYMREEVIQYQYQQSSRNLGQDYEHDQGFSATG